MAAILDSINAFRQMLADSPHFQDWCGAADAAAALARIHTDGLPPPAESADSFSAASYAALRPYALIYPSEGDPFRFEREAADNCWKVSGALICVLSKTYAGTDTPTEQFDAMAAAIENIVRSNDPGQPGLTELAGEAERLFLTAIRVDFVGRTPPEDREDYGDAYDVLLSVTWG